MSVLVRGAIWLAKAIYWTLAFVIWAIVSLGMMLGDCFDNQRCIENHNRAPLHILIALVVILAVFWLFRWLAARLCKPLFQRSRSKVELKQPSAPP